ncbi:MAG: hypothetical protein ACXW4B_00340 [Micavibrio sp.]
MMLYQLGFGAQGQTGQQIPDLSAILASPCFELDATLLNSYAGTGQVWSNVIAAPADGAATADYDFYRGADETATAADPTFNGVAGTGAAYWSFDGGDAFKRAGPQGLPETLHKTGVSDFTVICAFRFQQNNLEQRFFATQNSGGLTAGIAFGVNASERIILRQRGDSAAISAVLNDTILTSGTDYLCIASHSRATNTTRFWLNSRNKSEMAHSFNPGAGDASPLTIGARPTISAEFAAPGTRLYTLGLLNSFIDDPEAALIFDLLNARHGRIYA